MTDDDLDVAEGNWDESVGTIKERTGEEEAEIERRLDFEVWPWSHRVRLIESLRRARWRGA